MILSYYLDLFFIFNDTATTEIYTYSHTLALHYALPIFIHCPSPTVAPIETCLEVGASGKSQPPPIALYNATSGTAIVACARAQAVSASCRRRSAASSSDRKSTRLNSSH